jgi:hypothetical protein
MDVVPLSSTMAAEGSNSVPVLYRMNQLTEAKERAKRENKPIAWIATAPEYLAPYAKLMGNGSHAGTAYAIRALRNETIMVFSDARTENHHEPKIVDEALHSPNPHYNVPGVVVLTPALDKVICTAPFASDAQERIRIFTEALKKIRDKDSWKGPG